MQTKKISLYTLLFLISFGSVNAVLFTPGLPAISEYFHINAGTAQFAMTSYLIGYAFGQLLYGPLSNRYGRKFAILSGIGIEIFSAFLCILSAHLHVLNLLLFARFSMALGASVGVTMTFTLVSDLYHDHEAANIISYLIFAFAIMPGISISIGGMLVTHFTWVSCFYFLALYGLVLGFMTLTIPESLNQIDINAIKIKYIIYNYCRQLQDVRLVLSSLIMGLNTTFIYLFASIAPFIALHCLQLKADQYGFWNLFPSAGMFIGAIISAQLIPRLSQFVIIFIGVFITLLGIAFLMALLMILNSPISLFLPTFFIYLGLTFIFPNISVIATSQSIDKANASAMMNFINLGISGLIVTLVGLSPSHSLLFLPVLFLSLLMIELFLFIYLNHHVTFS